MAEISFKESPCYKYRSLKTSTTPDRSISDSGYDTSSPTFSSDLSIHKRVSEVSFSFDCSSLDVGTRLSSTTHSFTQDWNSNKLEDITNTNYSVSHSLLDVGTRLSSTAHSFTQDWNNIKLEDITNTNYSVSPSLTDQELSPSKKFKSSSDMRMRFRLNKSSKDSENQFLRRKNVTPPKKVNHERISLEGRVKVDIMYFLSERHHFEPVTEKIFSYLSGSDIISVSMVSKIWCNAVKNSLIALKKKRTYFKLSKENRDYDSYDRSAFHNQGYLANISNVMRSPSKRDLPPRSPPVSPSKYRFHVYQKEARKLSPDQQLVKCPRCTRPASWSPSQSTRAECKGFHCKFIFCTNCLCEYSNTHKCFSSPIFSISSCNRRPMISNLSKRKHNLRRL